MLPPLIQSLFLLQRQMYFKSPSLAIDTMSGLEKQTKTAFVMLRADKPLSQWEKDSAGQQVEA